MIGIIMTFVAFYSLGGLAVSPKVYRIWLNYHRSHYPTLGDGRAWATNMALIGLLGGPAAWPLAILHSRGT